MLRDAHLISSESGAFKLPCLGRLNVEKVGMSADSFLERNAVTCEE